MLDILLVDDETNIRAPIREMLTDAGHRVTEAADGAAGLAHARASSFDVVICDLRLPKVDGLTVFRTLRHESPDTDVVLMTAFATVAGAVAALKEGAHDYLTKPFDLDEVAVLIERIAAQRAVRRELADARAELSALRSSAVIIGRSPSMRNLFSRIDTIAHSDAPVLITGESGTGKELVARTLHDRSERREKPFIAVNCAAFPETLLEAELFGHERGAFTGAVKRREGRFSAANGGTLLLDEIAEIPLPAQAKLLRVLQDGVIEPLGTNESIKCDVRIMSATHRNLHERIAEGRFREDLFYRLQVLDVHIPPLRERRLDLPVLLEHFLRKYTPAGKPVPEISPAAWAVLVQHPFPGNVREFSHAIEHASVLAGGRQIQIEHLPSSMTGVSDAATGETAQGFVPLAAAAKEFEREYLLRALAHVGGKRVRAADILGISRKSLWEKLRQHTISGGPGDPPGSGVTGGSGPSGASTGSGGSGGSTGSEPSRPGDRTPTPEPVGGPAERGRAAERGQGHPVG